MRLKKANPQLQKYMGSPMLTLNPMVLEETMLGSRYLVNISSLHIIRPYGELKWLLFSFINSLREEED